VDRRFHSQVCFIQIFIVKVLYKMFILRITILSNLFYIAEATYEGLPLLHFAFKFLFYLYFFVMVLQVFRCTLHAEELLLTVWASFHIAVVNLDSFTPAVAVNIVLGCPTIKGCYLRRFHCC
jgi:hypothetical protein